MQKIKSLLLFGLLLNSLVAVCQVDLKNAPSTKYIVGKTNDTFLISTKPITNREYIIYVLWIYNVYGVDYPDNIVNAIPGMAAANNDLFIDEFYESQTPFQVIFKHSPSFVKDYIFNPRYIDYPVIGLSQSQASRFCKWLSDRYNESKLIKLGYFKPNPSQINEDCFVTESYLVEQYYGARIKEETIKWSDQLLIPVFRLPTQKELIAANAKKALFKDFKPFEYDTSSFLNYWHQIYLKISPSSLTLNYPLDKSELIKSTNNEWEINKQNFEELTFDNAGADKSKQIKDYYEIEKDSLGQMPFIIIDENINKEPIIMEKNWNDKSINGDLNKFYFFRFACSIKPNQFK